jgi:hypothetical protein
MKTARRVTAFLVMAFCATAASGQDFAKYEKGIPFFASMSSYRSADMQKLERNFLGSLNHPNDGVVESAIREVARLKLVQPLCCSEAIVERLHELTIEGRTPAIRYKAALASILFENPEMFGVEGTVEFANEEELFTAIAHRLNVQVLSMKAE